MILVGGTWKSGKTDFALKLSEDLRKIPLFDKYIIQEVATNINTKGHYPQIYDLVSLKQWLYGSNNRKLYIFDEASEYLMSRKSMSGMNIGFLQLIPQISKAHARMIVVGHNLPKIDKDLLSEVWCRGVFIKENLKTSILYSVLLDKPYSFTNVPCTTITFDPYDIAPFQTKPEGLKVFKDADKQLMYDWAVNDKTYKELGISAMQLHRKLKGYLRLIFDSELHT